MIEFIALFRLEW